MPMVGGKEYPYTPAGKAAAKKAAGMMTNPKKAPKMRDTEEQMRKRASLSEARKTGSTTGEASRAENATTPLRKDLKGTLAKKLASLKMAKGK